jgi:hypothetical protein
VDPIRPFDDANVEPPGSVELSELDHLLEWPAEGPLPRLAKP